MSTYTLQAIDGEQTIIADKASDLYHDVALKVIGNSPTGSLVLTARKSGSDVFEEIPDGTFDLANLNSIQFTGGVAEYKATITGITNASLIYLTDISQRA